MSNFGTSFEGQKYRAWLREEQEREAAKEAARLRELTRPVEENMRQLRKVEQKLLTEFPDHEAFISNDLLTKVMSVRDAENFNRDEARRFVARTPEYYECQQNADAMVRYFTNANIQLISCEMYRAAFEKLRAAALLIERPEPEQEPVATSYDYGIEDEPTQPSRPDRYARTTEGYSLEDGFPRMWSHHELDALSADDYARALRLKRVYRQPRPR